MQEAHDSIIELEPTEAGQPAILVVDDDEQVRIILAERLAGMGYRVLQASDGPEALAMLAADGAVRILITDVRMPGMSGLELADLAVARQGNLKIILISGYFLPDQTDRPVLKKPFRMMQLETLVRAQLAR